MVFTKILWYMTLTAFVYSCHKWKLLFIDSSWPENEVWSGRESRRLRDTRWEFSFLLPKRPFVTVGANHWSLSHCSLQGNESDSWLLTSHWLFWIKKKVCFLPPSRGYKTLLKFLLWLYLIFPKRYFSSMLFFVASKYVKWTETCLKG